MKLQRTLLPLLFLSLTFPYLAGALNQAFVVCSSHRNRPATTVIVDRFAGEWAVLECGSTFLLLPKELLPTSAQEGDVLHLTLAVDEAATTARRRLMQQLLDELLESPYL